MCQILTYLYCPIYLLLLLIYHVKMMYNKNTLCMHICILFNFRNIILFHNVKMANGCPRCCNCCEKSHGEGIPCSHEVPSCINCKGKHPAHSPSCQELKIQKEIRMISAYRNITLTDARDIVRGLISPSSSPPYSHSSDDYPELAIPGKDYLLSNNNSSHKNLSYAQASARLSPPPAPSYMLYVPSSSSFSSSSSFLGGIWIPRIKRWKKKISKKGMSSVLFDHLTSGSIKLLEEKAPGPSNQSVFFLIPVLSPLPMKEHTSITTNNSPASLAAPDADYIIDIIDLFNTISIHFPSFPRKISSLNLNVPQQLPYPASTSSSFDAPLNSNDLGK